MKRKLLPLLLLLIPFVVQASTQSSFTIDNTMSNIIILIKTTIGVLWNVKVILGLLILSFSWIIWFVHNSNNSNEGMSILLPITGTAVSSLLISYGVATQTSDLLNLNDGQIDPQLKDGRANISKMAVYKFTNGKETGK